MDDEVELRDGYFSQDPRCVARNVVEGGYTERNVNSLGKHPSKNTHLTEPQGKLKT